MRTYFEDQIGDTICLTHMPRRIISLVPSQTELLFDLGLDEEIIGITRYCIHPKEKCAAKTKIGGTKKFNFELISRIKPDLIIGNKEENYQNGIERLKGKYPVWMSNIINLEDAFGMMESIGKLTGKTENAQNIISRIHKAINHLDFSLDIRAAYFIWRNPYMAAGENTFINEMLKKCGLINVFGNLARYPEITESQIKEARPEVILLSSEPYPFKEKHINEFKEKFPDAKILLIDGTMFSWYGSRLLRAADYFKDLRRKIRNGN